MFNWQTCLIDIHISTSCEICVFFSHVLSSFWFSSLMVQWVEGNSPGLVVMEKHMSTASARCCLHVVPIRGQRGCCGRLMVVRVPRAGRQLNWPSNRVRLMVVMFQKGSNRNWWIMGIMDQSTTWIPCQKNNFCIWLPSLQWRATRSQARTLCLDSCWLMMERMNVSGLVLLNPGAGALIL